MKAVNISGKKFNKLVALYPTKKRSRRGDIFWMFRCECGNEKELNPANLKLGSTTSCGCGRASEVPVGKRYGNLTVIKQAENIRSKHGRILWVCICDCGASTIATSNNLEMGNTKTCGASRHKIGKLHPRWKGGRNVDSSGYVMIRGYDHPNCGKNGYMGEHVKIMSEMIGRSLKKGESVHHKNGIRNDNGKENLELWTKHQPAGQRVSDMITFCKSYLSQYEPINNKLNYEGE